MHVHHHRAELPILQLCPLVKASPHHIDWISPFADEDLYEVQSYPVLFLRNFRKAVALLGLLFYNKTTELHC